MPHTIQREREAVRDTATHRQETPAPEAGSLADIAPTEVVTKKVEIQAQHTKTAVRQKMRKELQRGLAASAYLNILFLVPLLFPGKDEYVNFHLRQGITLFAIGTLVSFLAWGSFIAWLGTGLVVAAVAVFAAVQAARGRKWKMPVIGTFAKKIAIE